MHYEDYDDHPVDEWEMGEEEDLTELYDEDDPWEELEEWTLEDIGVSGLYKGDWE